MTEQTETQDKAKRAPRTVPAAPGHKQAHEVIRGYIAYRRAQLQQIAGPPGVNRGGSGPIIAAAREHILSELDSLADWLEEGQPTPLAVLSEEDRRFWRDARRRGMTVPQEILDQL